MTAQASEQAGASAGGRGLYVNLSVGDLEASMTFFRRLGFEFDPHFSNDLCACMVLNERASVMLLRRPFFETFTPRQICDTARAVQCLLAFDCASRDEVDSLAERAVALGAVEVREPSEVGDGFMYSRSFADLDGHQWEVFWMREVPA